MIYLFLIKLLLLLNNSGGFGGFAIFATHFQWVTFKLYYMGVNVRVAFCFTSKHQHFLSFILTVNEKQ